MQGNLATSRSVWVIGFWIIGLLAIATRFWGLGRFPLVVFDEVYYSTMATQYLAGTPFIDRHPPTARFIFAALAKFAGANPNARFETTVMPYGDFPYRVLRMGSATAGVLVIVFIMLIGKELTHMPLVGLIAGLLAVFDNALTLFSRYILGDIFISCFGLAGLWCYLKKNQAPAQGTAWYTWLTLAGVSFGLSVGTKITGGLFLATAWFICYVQDKPSQRLPDRTAVLFLAGIPAVIVVVLMTAHFLLLDAHGPVLNVIGNADPRLHTSAIFEAIRNSHFIHQFGATGVVIQRVIEIIVGTLLTVGGHTGKFHALAPTSPSWAWPFLERPIPWVIIPHEHTVQVIHFIGNPAIWWGGLIALIYLLIKRLRHSEYKVADPLLFGYSLNLATLSLPLRQVFLYLYLPSLLFLILITATVLARLYQFRPKTVGTLVALAILTFIFFMPFTYGFPLTEEQIQRRAWLPDWNPLLHDNSENPRVP